MDTEWANCFEGVMMKLGLLSETKCEQCVNCNKKRINQTSHNKRKIVYRKIFELEEYRGNQANGDALRRYVA